MIWPGSLEKDKGVEILVERFCDERGSVAMAR